MFPVLISKQKKAPNHFLILQEIEVKQGEPKTGSKKAHKPTQTYKFWKTYS